MKSYHIHVEGIVQGVGFRPFVYRIAHENDLRGYVKNLGDAGVEIVIEGREENIKKFLRDLREKKPPLARIERIKKREIPLQGFDRFYIEKSSQGGEGGDSIIPPDVAICDDCLRELFNPADKRYMYPFIVCTNCGPRFTIIEDLPYDRINTTMKEFDMCDFCESEYSDPLNRRYHAEPVCCPVCGPDYRLYTSEGEEIRGDALKKAARLIDEGYIVAIKGIGGIHLACDATNEEAVEELRRRTLRPQKPFALMAKDLETIESFAIIDKPEREELTSYRRPILILRKKEPFPLPEKLAPGLHTIGVMLPYAGTHHILFHWSKSPVYVMTSANYPGLPMVKDNERAFEELKGLADYFLLHNRRILNRADDSVARFVDGRRAVIRRSRGFVPLPVEIPFSYSGLALGAELMNAFGIAKNGRVYPSQYIGNTGKIEVLSFMREAIDHFKRILRVKDGKLDLIIADLHPTYNTTKLGMELAEKLHTEFLQVQHHYAHVASIMAEHGLDEIIGIALDGVGYGTDGNVWGGEVIYLSYEDVERIAHIDYYPLPGGDLASYYPLRALMGILSNIYRVEEVGEIIRKQCPRAIESLKYRDVEFNVILNQLTRGINVSYASSTGRVLDAFSVLLNVAYRRTYEGEPAMKLESLALKGKNDLKFEIPVEGETIGVEELFNQALESRANPADIAYSVHLALGRAFGGIAIEKAKEFGAKAIGISGGVAYNELIVKTIRKMVETNGLKFYSTYEVPRGDNGINVGQAFLGGLYLEGYLSREDLML